MITQYGMSEHFGLMGLETVGNRYLDGRTTMNCSDSTAAEVDHEVMDLLKECYNKALDLLKENRDALDKIAAHLFEKETITGKEFMEIFNNVKGITPETSVEENTENIENTENVVTEEENV